MSAKQMSSRIMMNRHSFFRGKITQKKHFAEKNQDKNNLCHIILVLLQRKNSKQTKLRAKKQRSSAVPHLLMDAR